MSSQHTRIHNLFTLLDVVVFHKAVRNFSKPAAAPRRSVSSGCLSLLVLLSTLSFHSMFAGEEPTNPPVVGKATGAATTKKEAVVKDDADASSAETVIEMSPFVLTSKKDQGYGTTNSLGASRVVVPIKDTPATIISVNRQLISDTGALELVDALRWTSGVAVAAAPLNGQFSLRGQNTNILPLRDGLPVYASGIVFSDMATSERLEIIKGPAGSLYGVMSPGGIVNSVSKQPLGKQQTSLSATVSSTSGRQIYRSDLDSTGPLDADGKWRYRAIGATSNGLTYYNRKYRRELFSPIVTYTPTSSLQVLARFEYSDFAVANQASPWFANSYGQISTFIPREQVADEPWEAYRGWRRSFDVGIDKSLYNNKWHSRFTYRYDNSNFGWTFDLKNPNGVFFYDKSGKLIGRLGDRAVNFSDPSIFGSIIQQRIYRTTPASGLQHGAGYYWDNVGIFSIGPTKHQVLAYAAYYDTETHGAPTYAASQTNTPSFDFLRPTYEKTFNPNNVPLVPSSFADSKNNLLNYGVQDNISIFNNKLFLVGGIRHDKIIKETVNLPSGAFSRTVTGSNSVKVGVVGEPVNGASLFFNYSTTGVSGINPPT